MATPDPTPPNAPPPTTSDPAPPPATSDPAPRPATSDSGGGSAASGAAPAPATTGAAAAPATSGAVAEPATSEAAAAPVASDRMGTPWWVALIAGIALTITGLLLLSAPASTLVVIIQFLGIYWLIDGIVRLVSIFIDRFPAGAGSSSIGILGIFAGIVIIQHPLWSAILLPATLVIYLGVMGLVIGIAEVVMAFRGAGWGPGSLAS